MTSLQGGLSALRLVVGGVPSVAASFGIKWWHIGRDESSQEVNSGIFTVVFMSTSSSRFLIYFRSSLQQGAN